MARQMEKAKMTESRKPMAGEQNRCYTISDLQQMLVLSRASVTALLKKREFHWIQIGGRYRIPKKGFDAWLERQCQ